MKRLKSLITLSLFTILLFTGCDSGNSPETSSVWVSLSVGNVKEYQTIFENDTTYTVMEIIGKTKRSDGQEVYIIEYRYSYSPDTNYRRSYYYIKNGYLISTLLDSAEIYIGENFSYPFNEQKLAKEKPDDEETWESCIGGLTFKTNYIGDVETPIGIFKNVFEYQIDTIMATYYAKDYGHIGTIVFGDSLKIFINYIKINNKELGEYISLALPKKTIIQNSPIVPSLFGEIIIE